MRGLTRALARLLRRAAGLLPADRRDWAEAAWAEAGEVPAGRPRLAWLAGGLWMAVRQARVARRAGCWLVFAAAAGIVQAGWAGAAANPATTVNRVDVIAVVVMLAGLPWAARRWVGPAGDGRLARAVRAGGYAAIFALVLSKASVERYANAPPYGHWSASLLWAGEIFFLLAMAAYAAWILAVTARRSPAAPASLAIGTAAGAVAGLVMYARVYLHSASPGLAGLSAAATALTWAALPAAPVVAALAAARRAPGRDSRLPPGDDRARQGLFAGLCAGVAAALVASALGTGTAAFLPHEPVLLSWAYPVRHLAHDALIRYAADVSQATAAYIFALLLFPLIGAGLGAWAGMSAIRAPGQRPGGGGPPAPAPDPPPPGGREITPDNPPRVLADAGMTPEHPSRIPVSASGPQSPGTGNPWSRALPGIQAEPAARQTACLRRRKRDRSTRSACFQLTGPKKPFQKTIWRVGARLSTQRYAALAARQLRVRARHMVGRPEYTSPS
jgi:hypothetical protein